MKSRGSRKLLKNGLTPKENGFKNEILRQITENQDINGTQAVLKVYDTTDPKTAGVIAVENFAKPSIKEEIEKSLEKLGITSDLILDQVKELSLAQPKEISADVKLKANLSLLKLMGAFPDGQKSTFTIKKTIQSIGWNEAKQEIEAMTSESTELIQDVDL